MSAFVDTSAFVAMLDTSDRQHEAALDVWERCQDQHLVLTTTNYVVSECTAVLQRKLELDAVRDLWGGVLALMHVEWVTTGDHEAGAATLLAVRRRELSFVDCVSFVVMRRLGFTHAFAFDKHFAEQGFELLA